MYRETLDVLIKKLDLKEKGIPLTVPEKEDEARSLVIKAIEILNESDYFDKDTTLALATLGWDRKNGWDRSKLEANPVVEAVVEEPVEEEPIVDTPEDDTLVDFIRHAENIKDLKDICKAEDEFKRIRGSLASFKDIDELRTEMLRIFNHPLDEIASAYNTEASKTLDKLILDKKVKTTQIDVSLIKTRPPFSNLFAIDKVTLGAVTDKMKESGYDNAFPLILWGDVCIDGHTRLQAAILAGLEKVPVEVKEFKDEKEALKYAIHNQRDRRNLGDAELLRCIREVDQPLTKEEAGAKRTEKIEPTHKKTAKELGIGESLVSDARTVLADPVATKEVEEGKTTIRKAARKVRADKGNAKKGRKAKVSAPLTPIEAVAQALRESAGETIPIGSIFMSSQSSEEVVNTVLEVCVAIRMVKVSGDMVTIKKILK